MAHIVPDDLYFLMIGIWKEARKKAKTVDEVKSCNKILKLLIYNCPEFRKGMNFEDDVKLY